MVKRGEIEFGRKEKFDGASTQAKAFSRGKLFECIRASSKTWPGNICRRLPLILQDVHVQFLANLVAQNLQTHARACHSFEPVSAKV